MTSKPVLLGGEPVRTDPFVVGYDPTTRDLIGEEEIEAVTDVLRSQRLSGFLADSSEAFFGGPKVQELETAWADHFDTEHCVAVNSATSGLFAAVGAADVGPGDEVIVPPLTMSASATAILGHNGVPVFADVESETANVDPDSIRERVTDRTKAIVVVHLFGYPAAMDEILEIAEANDLIVIEDAAQSIGATYDGQYTGTIGDLGVFSLNVHKHIQTGEGGIVATDDRQLARRVQLIRNHGEAVVGSLDDDVLGPLDFPYEHVIGGNYRMTEVEAAIAREQLKKLPGLLEDRVRNAERLTDELASVTCVTTPSTRSGSTHSYYVYPLLFDPKALSVDLDVFVRALDAEGIPASRYVEPLYLLPVYQNARAYGDTPCPFECPWYDGEVSYERGICPTAERLSSEELLVMDAVMPTTTTADLRDIRDAITKIEAHDDELADAV
ncbi:MAG: DegT/DnrJ/EryC1/StrS family aminotransferase [Natronomonas sp.]|uniref:DegT/DnrJ/EryC1/StrS family aminotransferase n=1 Tax=Natronomonas sp. TaxID=2184060 RepID=UPI00287061C5|nr:DegT/DnrJ/EryC1/StrS family aminotransferase [Natronomonas sp.]MDR9431917.1 DegT/DnrJ/EryC1/StrS family aminotransferase [Natronomonas sp.]